jgi:hypothetical protein
MPYDLLFGALSSLPDKHRTTNYHEIHNYARQHLQLVSDGMQTR